MPRVKQLSDEAVLAGVLRLVQRVGPDAFTLAAAGAEVGLSASTLVQRFGSKRALLLAADQWAVEQWVGGMDEVSAELPPLERLVAGLLHAVDPDMTSAQMANSVALLQVALADKEFHGSTRDGAVRLRGKILERLQDALDQGDLQDGTDVDALAHLVETTYHGAMISWAIHREGPLVAFLTGSFARLLRPYRVSSGITASPRTTPGCS